jgi:DNA polymerase I-like protein with 3'-5' exonuclease and polymerase domains
MENTETQIISMVHDKIILEVHDRLANEATAILNGKVSIEVDFTVAYTWAEK